MCLLVARLAGSNWLPTEDEFDNAWRRNPDGFGVAYANANGITVLKTLNALEAYQILHSIPENAPALLHWRMGTHGSVSVGNCHPFKLPKAEGWVGAHHGVLSIQAKGNLTDSETYFRTLKAAPRIDLIETFLQSTGGGKMAFLHESGEIRIANESHRDASWRTKHVWQSNDSLDGPSAFWGFGAKHSLAWEHASECDYGDSALEIAGFQRLKCDFCGISRVHFLSPKGDFLCEDCAEDAADMT